MSELSRYRQENEASWMNRGETMVALVLELAVERQEGLKFVPYSPFVLSSHGTYFICLKMETDPVLKELAVSELGVEPWLRICSTEELQCKAQDAVSGSAVLEKW